MGISCRDWDYIGDMGSSCSDRDYIGDVGSSCGDRDYIGWGGGGHFQGRVQSLAHTSCSLPLLKNDGTTSLEGHYPCQ